MSHSAPSSLPCAGRIACDLCHGGPTKFNETRTKSPDGGWRLTANPLAWGNPRPEVLVLGFSKGPNAQGALRRKPYDAIAYDGGRIAVGKILAHVGLLEAGANASLRRQVDAAIADPRGRFGWGSLIRCTVERFDRRKGEWVSSGGGMLDKFVSGAFGRQVANACAVRFLSGVPSETRLVVMFGLGSKLNYVRASRRLFEEVRPGPWRSVNEVAFTDGELTVVHVEHFASQGAHLPNWLGENDHPRSGWGCQAREAVAGALAV